MKNLDFYFFATSLWLSIFEEWCKCIFKNKLKNFENFFWHLEGLWRKEQDPLVKGMNPRIRIRTKMSRIRNNSSKNGNLVLGFWLVPYLICSMLCRSGLSPPWQQNIFSSTKTHNRNIWRQMVFQQNRNMIYSKNGNGNVPGRPNTGPQHWASDQPYQLVAVKIFQTWSSCTQYYFTNY